MIRKIARPMLASVFILDGVDALRKTNERVDTTEDLIKRVRKFVPADIADAIPDSPKTVARILGGTKVGAGSLFAIGKAPRFAAATLAVTTLPTLISRDAFWAADEEGERRARLNNFATSSALLGGLFIASQDTEGKPGLKWRAEHASKQAGKKVQQALPTKTDSEKMWDEAREKAGDFTGQAGDWIKDSSEKAQAYVNDNKGDWSKTANEWLDAARSNAKTAK
ncbi:DoxX family protein, partial [Corynebacterium propinquum]